MSQNWYYTKDGKQQFGPFTDIVFSSMAAQGSIGPKDYVRTDSMKKWVLADNIKGLKFEQLPEISIPFVIQGTAETAKSIPTVGNSPPSAVSQDTNEPAKVSQVNKEPLEKQKPVNSEFKNTGGGIGTTMLTAGAGAAIGLGVGAILGNSLSTGSSGTSNLIDSQGLNQRLQALNMQGLLSDNDYQIILQLLNNPSASSIGRFLPNRSKKTSHLTLKNNKGNPSSGQNSIGADDSLDEETIANEESELEGVIDGENSELTNQEKEEILDAEDGSSDMDDGDILDAEDLENEEEEIEAPDAEEETDEEDLDEDDIQDDDMDDGDLDDDMNDGDLDDDMDDGDMGDGDLGGGYSGDDE